MRNHKVNLAQTKKDALHGIIWCATVLGVLIMLAIWKKSGASLPAEPNLRAAALQTPRIVDVAINSPDPSDLVPEPLKKQVPKIEHGQYSNPIIGTDMQSDGIDDTVTAIVQCSTTRGEVVMDVRAGWSPVGAVQFLKLVDLGHFTDLPFTRVAPRYITQFGRKYIAPDSPEVGYLKRGGISTLKDDPTMWGKRDMDFGYVFYAGSGPDSRFDEMVVALCPMGGCIQTGLGKAFWETPVATIRKEYHGVLREIMASGKPYPRLEMKGQHPDASGPDALKLMHDPDYLKTNYPFMEYWKSCAVVERNVLQVRALDVDHPDSTQRGRAAKTEVQAASASEPDPGNGKPFTVELDIVLDSNAKEDISTVVIEVSPDWAPLGAQQFHRLLDVKYFDDCKFFRVLPGFMVQFGIHADPKLGKAMKSRPAIKDDASNVPLSQGNARGRLSFAMAGPNTRTTQMFINTGSNNFLDKQGFTPLGQVTKGMEIIDSIVAEYKELPDQGKIQNQGNAYLNLKFPRLSYIKNARII